MGAVTDPLELIERIRHTPGTWMQIIVNSRVDDVTVWSVTTKFRDHVRQDIEVDLPAALQPVIPWLEDQGADVPPPPGTGPRKYKLKRSTP